jgi:hypothetical protein
VISSLVTVRVQEGTISTGRSFALGKCHER